MKEGKMQVDRSPAAWTHEAIKAHLSETFSIAAKQFPALLEPYEILLADAHDDAARVEIMRRGLRETIKERYPMHPPSAPETPALNALIKAGMA